MKPQKHPRTARADNERRRRIAKNPRLHSLDENGNPKIVWRPVLTPEQRAEAMAARSKS